MLRMKRKITLCIVFLVVITGSTMIGLGSYEVARSLSRDVHQAQELRMRMAWSALVREGEPFRIHEGNLLAGETVLNNNAGLVDRIGAAIGGAVTIFLGEERIATSIHMLDGSRAIGTQWSFESEKDAIFRQNTGYRGEASIFGERYWIATDPIWDSENKVIGALQLAVRKTETSVALEGAIRRTSLVMLLGTLVIGSVVYAALHSLTCELQKMSWKRQLILESADEGIYGLDREGRCTFINQAGANLLGYRPCELVGKAMHPLIHHHRLDGAPYPISDCALCTLSSLKKVRRRDEAFWRKDGSPVSVRYVFSPIIYRGTVRGAVVAFHAINGRGDEESVPIQRDPASVRMDADGVCESVSEK